MRILVALEDNKGPDRVSEHLPTRSQQPWNHKSRLSDLSRSPQRKESLQGTQTTETEVEENHGRSEEAE